MKRVKGIPRVCDCRWRAATRRMAYARRNKTRIYMGLATPHFTMRGPLSKNAAAHQAVPEAPDLRLDELAVPVDAHQDTGADEEREQRGAAIGKERQRHADH